MVRWTVALLGAIIVLAAVPVLTWAQAAPPATHLLVARDAAVVLDSLATVARATRTETAGCIAGYTVQHDTLLLTRVTGARYARSDSVTIWAKGPLCGTGVPTVHAHVIDNGWLEQPSPVDIETKEAVGTWAALLSVYGNGWLLRLY